MVPQLPHKQPPLQNIPQCDGKDLCENEKVTGQKSVQGYQQLKKVSFVHMGEILGRVPDPSCRLESTEPCSKGSVFMCGLLLQFIASG